MKYLSHIEQVDQWKNLKTYVEIETVMYYKRSAKTTRKSVLKEGEK
tara:strand:- start:782 stop:919 length:138 start_codon:yes stop_codon:yes gene_type:complete